MSLILSSALVGVLTSGNPDWQGRTSIKRRPSDDALVMVYHSSTAHHVNAGSLQIVFSDDDGATWTDPNMTLGGAGVTGFPMTPPDAGVDEDPGEPWLMVAPNGNLILHMWEVDYGVTNGGTWQSISDDGGHSWSTPTQVAFVGNPGDDDDTFATDDDFVLDGVIYAAVRVYADETGPDSGTSIVGFISSDDNGATWDYISTVYDGDSVQEIGFEYVGNDRIVALIRDGGNAGTYYATSDDLGQTWDVSDVTSQFGATSRHRIYTLAHLRGEANWWTDPHLIACGFRFPTPGSSQPRQPMIWLSEDAGANWEGHAIDAVTDDTGYGDLFYAGSHYGHVTYYGTLATARLRQYNLFVVDRIGDEDKPSIVLD